MGQGRFPTPVQTGSGSTGASQRTLTLNAAPRANEGTESIVSAAHRQCHHLRCTCSCCQKQVGTLTYQQQSRSFHSISAQTALFVYALARSSNRRTPRPGFWPFLIGRLFFERFGWNTFLRPATALPPRLLPAAAVVVERPRFP